MLYTLVHTLKRLGSEGTRLGKLHDIQGFPKLTKSCSHFSKILVTTAEVMAKIGYSIQGTSSQSEGYSSKWIIWLVCRKSHDIVHVSMKGSTIISNHKVFKELRRCTFMKEGVG